MNFPLFATFYFYASFLEIIISLVRCLNFTQKLQFIKETAPLRIAILLFLASVLINFPYFFAYVPNKISLPLADQQNITINFIDLSNFGKSQIGNVYILMIYVIRDIFTFFTGLLLNVLSIVLTRQHFKQKKKF